MKRFFTLIALFIVVVSYSQTGTIAGKLLDKESNNQPLPFANIVILGTSQGTSSDFDGLYEITNIPAGTYTVEISFTGYETVKIPNVVVEADKVTVVDTALAAEAATLDDVVITVQTNREREEALLLEQKKAVEIKQVIGAEELSRKGASDAEDAVTKVSGVSKQEGVKNVFVRGLGDRYNSTSLNGLPLPSEDPEYKNISLDFFNTDVIKAVDINKVFNTQLYGDVGGANININSKELSGKSSLKFDASLGANSQTISEDFLTMDGGNFFGTVDKEYPVSNLRSYDFENSFLPEDQSNLLNTSFSISGGKKFEVGDNTLSVFLVGSMDNSYRFQEGFNRQTTSTGDIYQDQDYKKYNYSVSQLVMSNIKYSFSSGNSISLNNIYIHKNNQSVGEYEGFNNPEQDGDLEFLRRQQQNNNNLLVNQIIGKFKLNEKIDLDAKGSFNLIRGSEPDRRSNKFLFRNGQYNPDPSSAGNNERYFSQLNENDLAAIVSATYKLESTDDFTRNIEVGYNFRNTNRDFEALIYNHDFFSLVPIELDNPDVIFNQNNLTSGTFELETGRGSSNNPRALDPFTYNGTRIINAGFGKLNYQFNEKLVSSVGIRYENIIQEVEYDTNLATSDINGIAEVNNDYILPSFSFKYILNDKSNLRLAGSLSYTYPQFKEVAPFQYSDISFSSQGNPDLIPSDNYNADIKWEYYFTPGELLSITGFYKHIENPIARSEIPSAGNTLTYLNVGGNASVAGIELELRKNILNRMNEDTENGYKLNFGVNVSYLNSVQELSNPLASFTNDEDELQGATPLLTNTDLTFNLKQEGFDLNSTLVFNYYDDRVYSIGTRGFENIIETGIPTLDFISKSKIGEHFGVSLKLKNLLNPNFQLVRKSSGTGSEVVLSEYKKGINASLGFSYEF